MRLLGNLDQIIKTRLVFYCRFIVLSSIESFVEVMAPDTNSIAGYTIFREGDYDSAEAAAVIPRDIPHPLGTMFWI
jgi:hypothetical protein